MKPNHFVLLLYCIPLCVSQTEAQWRLQGPSALMTVQTQIEADRFQRLEAAAKQGASLSLPAALQMALDSARILYNHIGVSAAMIIPGYGLWLGTSGYSIPGDCDTITTDMIFGIASCTKTYIAALTLKLQEEGLLSLDDSLHKWLPTWRRDQYRYIDSNITIRQLLNHTSGLAEFGTDSWYYAKVADPDRIWMPESLLTHFVGPPQFAAGASWEYCNTNYLLAGLIINAVTGSSLSTQLHQKFLAPLNLRSTYLAIEDTLPANRAHPWGDYWDYSRPRADLFGYQVNSHYSSILACGGMFSKPENMVRWISNLLGGKVLNPSSLDQMLTATPHSEEFFRQNYSIRGGYGLGVAKSWKPWGNLVLIHDGQTPGYESVTAFFPAARLSLATAQNSNDPAQRGGDIIGAALFEVYLWHTLNASTDKTYCTPGIDTLWLRARVANPNAHSLTVKAYIDASGTVADSLHLYDDGLHRDSVAGDGVWGVGLRPPATENLFKLTVSRFDQVDSTCIMRNDLRFTTAGPLILDSVAVTKFLSSYRLKPYVRNNGTSFTLRGAKVGFSCNDPWVKSIGTAPLDLPDLAPGSRAATSSVAGITPDPATNPGYANVKVGIAVEGFVYWTDSMTVYFPPEGVDEVETLPVAYALEQNYPNPFNPSTTIRYGLPSRSRVTLQVFNTLGQKVTTLLDEEVDAGYHEAQFDASHLASGVYLYRLTTGGFVQARKMILVR